MILIIDSINYY